MELPKVPQNLQQERKGILAVAMELNRLGLIWRETPMTDVGIDGQIEFVDDAGNATGRLMAAQIKSGNSYFHDHGETWRFYPESKHRFYWERFPIPVLVVLHSPADGWSYWADARLALRSPRTASEKYIAIPKKNRLQDSSSEALFSSTGANTYPFLPLNDVFLHLIMARSQNASFPISHFDLFVNGLTNIVRTLYFSMDLAVQIAEVNLALNKSDFGMGVGPSEHDFLFEYVQFITAQHLADFDFSDCLIDWYDREMQPRFLAPLTSRGRALVHMISELQDKFEAEGKLIAPDLIRVAQEGLVHRFFGPSDIQRLPLIKQFQDLFLIKKSNSSP